MRKKTFYTELSYLLGIIILPFGVVLMERANFGISMVVAPAYLIYRIVHDVMGVAWFDFSWGEAVLQTVLLLGMLAIMRKFKLSYLFSFVTAVLYAVVLKGMEYFPQVAEQQIALRLALYVIGMVVCSLGVCLFFHTYISPEVYELFVKELAEKFGIRIHLVKTVYDCVSSAIALTLSLVFFGWWPLVGINWGTIVCALINGWIIGQISKLLERYFIFQDRFPLRRFFK